MYPDWSERILRLIKAHGKQAPDWVVKAFKRYWHVPYKWHGY